MKRNILAYDAIVAFSGAAQFDLKLFARDLDKAYAAFSGDSHEGSIATGNWGCGGSFWLGFVQSISFLFSF
jgi:hypothetical protein